MKMPELRPGLRVYDRWWPKPIMRVLRVMKTRARLDRGGEVVTYDAAHAQFLEVAPTRRSGRRP